MFKVVCINDSNRPNEIPASKWIKKDQEYTVTYIMKCHVQGGTLGFRLSEIDLSGCSPYEYFAADRFAPKAAPTEVTEEIEELATA